jgi:hypothetical protein
MHVNSRPLARQSFCSTRHGSYRTSSGPPLNKNFKVHFYQQDTMVSPPIKLAVPFLFNLGTNPREDTDKQITGQLGHRSGAQDGR